MKRRFSLALLTVLIGADLCFAQSDSIAYRAAESSKDPGDKIESLESFLKTYPTSRFAGNASLSLFRLYVDQGNEAAALSSASRYLEPIDPANRMGPYNEIAYELALKNIGLDSALVYATRASDMARSQGAGMLSAIEDTRALVLYRRGNPGEAEKVQQSIMSEHRDDPDYLEHLAMYEAANGERRPALATISRALYDGGPDEMKKMFTNWLQSEGTDSASRDAMRQSVVMETVRSLFDSIPESQIIAVRSRAARFMAGMGVHLPTARQWARDAVESIGPSTPAEDAISYKENLALVTAASGRLPEALSLLRTVQDYVTPWETDFWMTLGSTCEQAGDLNGAVKAYTEGLTVINSETLRKALTSVYAKLNGSTDGLEGEIDKAKQDGASFDPGHMPSSGPSSGRVVLAELFTGAECGPCVGADKAFDALREYYPTSALAILEYHVHIPGPDPLTTNDSWDRYQAYRGSGTPTVVVNGTEKIVGGGPKTIAKNRFTVYRYAIDQGASEAPPVSLAAALAREGENIAVDVRVRKTGTIPDAADPALFLALVERSVNYLGANGISDHAMVVRKLFYGPKGTPLALGEREDVIHAKTNLDAVDAELRSYLNDPQHQSSWPKYLRKFGGWRPHPDSLNRANLSVVAWVQDLKSMKVLQATLIDVPTGSNSGRSPMSSGSD